MKVDKVREYHTVIYNKVWYVYSKPNQNGKGTKLYHNIRTYMYESGEPELGVLHDAACFILNNDKTYASVVGVIDNNGNVDGYIYKILYHYTITKLKSLKDNLNEVRLDALIETQFKDGCEYPGRLSVTPSPTDRLMYKYGHYQRSMEDYYIGNELWTLLNHTAGDVLAEDMLDGLSVREIAKKHKLSRSKIHRRLQEVRSVIEKEWDR